MMAETVCLRDDDNTLLLFLWHLVAPCADRSSQLGLVIFKAQNTNWKDEEL